MPHVDVVVPTELDLYYSRGDHVLMDALVVLPERRGSAGRAVGSDEGRWWLGVGGTALLPEFMAINLKLFVIFIKNEHTV